MALMKINQMLEMFRIKVFSIYAVMIYNRNS